MQQCWDRTKPNFKEAMLGFSKGMSLDDEIKEFLKTDTANAVGVDLVKDCYFRAASGNAWLYGVI